MLPTCYQRFTALFCLLLFAGIGPGVFAAEQPAVKVSEIETRAFQLVGPHLWVLEDKAQQWTIKEVRNLEDSDEFKPAPPSPLNFGYTKSAYWVRFELYNDTQEIRDILLEVGSPLLDKVSLFGPSDTVKGRVLGDTLPFSEREFDHPNFIFQLRTKPGETTTWYLRAENKGTVALPITLYTSKHFVKQNTQLMLLLGGYYSVMLVMFFYNLFLFFAIRDSSYLYYITYIASLSLALLSTKGIAFQYLWPDATWWHNQSPLFFFSISTFAVFQFGRLFLHTRELVPWLDKILLVMVVLAGSAIVLNFVIDYRLMARLLSLLGASSIFLLVVGVICMAKGDRPARYFVAAWTVFLLGVLVFTMKNFELVPTNTLTDWAIQIGSSLEVVLLSLGLADRFNQMRQERDDMARAQKVAESTAATKSAFLATMSHEIRTPMNGVIGMTTLLRDTPLDKHQREYVETIRSSGESLLAIINDILDFSKIESKKLRLEAQPFLLKPCIKAVFDLLSTAAAEKNLQLGYRVDDNVPEAIISDVTRLRQILVNLVGNAVKFTHQGGVTVKVRQRRNSSDPEYIILEFAVHDTGIGISKEKLDVLFKPFSQIDDSTTRKYGGTGLGLAICHQLVELMGGTIWVKSETGKGASFYFTIQAKPADHVAAAELIESGDTTEPVFQENMADSLPLKILLAEDNPINQKLAVYMLQKMGYSADVVSNGLEVLNALEWQHYDIIFMDLQMPEMDGLETTRRLRDKWDDEDLPRPKIIAMTANSMQGDRETCLAAGMDDYLSKPIDPVAVQQALLRWGERSEAGLAS